jgi:hypothetical protein
VEAPFEQVMGEVVREVVVGEVSPTYAQQEEQYKT